MSRLGRPLREPPKPPADGVPTSRGGDCLHAEKATQARIEMALQDPDDPSPGGGAGPCPPSTTCTEVDLVVFGRPCRGTVPSLVGDLITAATSAQREHLIRNALRACGFDWMSYVTETLHDGRGWRAHSLVTYTNPTWQRCHDRGYCGDADPRVREAARSSMPLVWHCAEGPARTSVAEVPSNRRRFIDDLERCGIGSGLSFVMPCASGLGTRRTVIHLMSSRRGTDWLGEAGLARALMLGFSLQEFYTCHTDLAAPLAAVQSDAAILLPVQQEIAHHLLQGRSDKEIAALLHMSSHTVDYHMRQLRQRFAARNRVQIVSALRQSAHAVVPAHA